MYLMALYDKSKLYVVILRDCLIIIIRFKQVSFEFDFEF